MGQRDGGTAGQRAKVTPRPERFRQGRSGQAPRGTLPAISHLLGELPVPTGWSFASPTLLTALVTLTSLLPAPRFPASHRFLPPGLAF